MKNKNNKKTTLNFVILILIILGLIGYIAFDKISNVSVLKDYAFSFDAYASLLNEQKISGISSNLNEFSVFSKIYLKDNCIYGVIREDLDSMNLSNNDKINIKKLKLQSVDLLVDYNDKTKQSFINVDAYKFPIENVVLMSEVYIGHATSPTIMFETKDGIVYSFSTDQTGASGSLLFNESGNLNIKEETKFKNIIKFVNYNQSDGYEEYRDYYAIDINGKVIYR